MEIAAGFGTSRTRSKLKRRIISRDLKPLAEKLRTELRTALSVWGWQFEVGSLELAVQSGGLELAVWGWQFRVAV
jgi:hypothetical protein